jgi:hypothetical protein
MKSTVDAKLIPAFTLQKVMLGTMQSSIGTSADSGQVPSADTSIYNDINYLRLLPQVHQLISILVSSKTNCRL